MPYTHTHTHNAHAASTPFLQPPPRPRHCTTTASRLKQSTRSENFRWLLSLLSLLNFAAVGNCSSSSGSNSKLNARKQGIHDQWDTVHTGGQVIIHSTCRNICTFTLSLALSLSLFWLSFIAFCFTFSFLNSLCVLGIVWYYYLLLVFFLVSTFILYFAQFCFTAKFVNVLLAANLISSLSPLLIHFLVEFLVLSLCPRSLYLPCALPSSTSLSCLLKRFTACQFAYITFRFTLSFVPSLFLIFNIFPLSFWSSASCSLSLPLTYLNVSLPDFAFLLSHLQGTRA